MLNNLGHPLMQLSLLMHGNQQETVNAQEK